MEDIIKFLSTALNEFFSFKAFVILPIFMFIIALIGRMKIKDAILSTVKIAAGFAGVFIVFTFFVSQISPAVSAVIEVRHLDYPVVDVGWPPLAAITWSSLIAPITIVAVIILNLVMLATKMTKTLYIDLWNYWHFALLGALIQTVTASFPLALASTLTIALYNIKTTEWTAPYVKREMGFDSIAISPISVAGFLPYAVLLNKLFDMIPGFKKIKWDPSRTPKEKKSASLLGEPMIIGALVGLFLSILAAYDLKKSLETIVNISAVMFLLPRCGGLIGEGMGAVANALKLRIETKFKGMQGLSIAMDTGILMTNPSVTTTGLILIPISVLIAFILPGNQLIPLGDLPNLMSIMSVVVLVMGGNVFRAVIAGIPIVASFMLIASFMAPVFTSQAAAAGMNLASDGKLITAFTDGGNQIRYLLYMAYQGNVVALVIIPGVLLMLWYSWRNHKKILAQ